MLEKMLEIEMGALCESYLVTVLDMMSAAARMESASVVL